MIGKLFRHTTAAFEQISPNLQFLVLVVGVFIFFGTHNYLQEAIMSVDGFEFGVMLGYFEVLGVTVCSFIERRYIVMERGRKAPLSAYPLLTLCLLSSSALSNISLNYINFPTKVVFRSCKLIPTMMIASIVHRKSFTALEYICAAAACIGLILFAAADWEMSPDYHPVGIFLVSMSVCADALLPNAQEGLFKLGSSRLEVTFYTNIFTLLIMTLSTVASGDLPGALLRINGNHQLKIYFAIYTFVAYIAISFHMNVVKRYGGVAAVLVATGRKAMTLILSFLLFPKSFSWFYPLGAILVLGGLLVSSLAKINAHRKKSDSRPLNVAAQQQQQQQPHSHHQNHHHQSNEDVGTLKSHGSDVSLIGGKDDIESAKPSTAWNRQEHSREIELEHLK